MLTLVSDVWSSRFKALNRSESVEKIKFKIVSIEIAKVTGKKLSQIFFKINGSRVNCDNRDRDNQKTKNIFLLSQNYVKWAPDVGFTLFKALNSLESREKKEFNVRT